VLAGEPRAAAMLLGFLGWVQASRFGGGGSGGPARKVTLDCLELGGRITRSCTAHAANERLGRAGLVYRV